MQNFQVSSNKYIMEVSLKQQKYRNTSWNFLSDVWNPNCFYKQHHCEELWFGDDGEEVSICEQAANAPANDDCNGLKGEWQTRSRLPHWFDWTEMNMNWQEGKKQRVERKKERKTCQMLELRTRLQSTLLKLATMDYRKESIWLSPISFDALQSTTSLPLMTNSTLFLSNDNGWSQAWLGGCGGIDWSL